MQLNSLFIYWFSYIIRAVLTFSDAISLGGKHLSQMISLYLMPMVNEMLYYFTHQCVCRSGIMASIWSDWPITSWLMLMAVMLCTSHSSSNDARTNSKFIFRPWHLRHWGRMRQMRIRECLDILLLFHIFTIVLLLMIKY